MCCCLPLLSAKPQPYMGMLAGWGWRDNQTAYVKAFDRKCEGRGLPKALRSLKEKSRTEPRYAGNAPHTFSRRHYCVHFCAILTLEYSTRRTDEITAVQMTQIIFTDPHQLCKFPTAMTLRGLNHLYL